MFKIITVKVILVLIFFTLISCEKKTIEKIECYGNGINICAETHYINNECIGYIQYYYLNEQIASKKIVSYLNDIIKIITIKYDSLNNISSIEITNNKGYFEEIKFLNSNDTLLKILYYLNNKIQNQYEIFYNNKKQITTKLKFDHNGILDSIYQYFYYSDDKLYKIKSFSKNSGYSYTIYEYYSNSTRIKHYNSNLTLFKEEIFFKDSSGKISKYSTYNHFGNEIYSEKYFYENSKLIRTNIYNANKQLEKYIIYSY